ncbi:ferric reductase like transmembrane component [Tricladium varicosporioides]|nr:ferric reductase like transmembrane component [Hymenoscyphus varicosporioides]
MANSTGTTNSTGTASAAAAKSAAAAAKAKQALAKAMRQRNNENSVKFLAAGAVGIMVIFMLSHLIHAIYKRATRKSGPKGALRFPVAISRNIKSVLLRKVPGLPSVGHTLVVLGYAATTITVAFVNIEWTTLNGWAKRLGWVTCGNITLITFLALKNTPLAFLTAYSYERLNILHRIAGYATVFFGILHAVIYTIAESKSHSLLTLIEDKQIMGITAGFAMLISLSTALLLRKLRYEIFYVVHIVMFMLIVITVAMHRPNPKSKSVYIMVFTGSIWVADRLIRFAKISFFTFGNSATITPLSHGGTQIVMKKSPFGARPGAHCFLWIPGVRAAETHPFTITSVNPLKLVVKAHDGFTRDLHRAALEAPGRVLRASVDGPYGTQPNFTTFNKVVLIAGGSGASYTFGVVIDLLRKIGQSKGTSIEFIWVVKNKEMITWFSSELQTLSASPSVALHIHNTSLTSPASSTYTPTFPVPPTAVLSPASPLSPASSKLDSSLEKELGSQLRKESSSVMSLDAMSIPLKSGRPDLPVMITGAIESASIEERVAVAACGPEGMMEVVRRSVAANVKGNGAGVELFLEQFGW